MNEQEPVNDGAVSKRESADVVKEPGGRAGMLATRLSTYGKPMGAIALTGLGAYVAIGVVETIAHVIGFVAAAGVVYYGVKTYKRHHRHDEP